MAKGFGYEYNLVLRKAVMSNKAKGIPVRDLRAIFEFHVWFNKLDIPLTNSIYTAITEMWCVANEIEHEIAKNRQGTIFKGIGLKTDSVWELIETLNLGIEGSDETRAVAEELYKDVMENDDEITYDETTTTEAKK